MIELRPHHGLCVRYFEGKGYNGEFSAHMADVIESLRDDTVIKLVDKRDVICEKCPNRIEDGCKSIDKVRRYDKSVLELTGLDAGGIMEYGRLRRAVTDNICKPGKMDQVCSDCGWAAICHKKQ